ncbi:MAG: malonate transporter subunit MadL [Syntrophales bacterium]|nr:malonate transporter subunit MadL [Syntrophales bacterium]
MEIYGLAILTGVFLLGELIGYSLGKLLHVGDVGGVGFAMLFLIILTNTKFWEEKVAEKTKSGIQFIGAIYVPIIVAMVLQSNIIGAFKGGFIAFLAGGLAVFGLLLLTPFLAKYAKIKNDGR